MAAQESQQPIPDSLWREPPMLDKARTAGAARTVSACFGCCEAAEFASREKHLGNTDSS